MPCPPVGGRRACYASPARTFGVTPQQFRLEIHPSSGLDPNRTMKLADIAV